MNDFVESLICPVCDSCLRQVGNMLKCPNEHSFDLAREGYINLLPSNQRQKLTGDTKEMLRNRREFLQAGYHGALSETLNSIASNYFQPRSRQTKGSCVATVLDAGCGEGYYITMLKKHLDKLGNAGLAYFGLDISKEAIRMAAKNTQSVRFIVANTKVKIPFADSSIQVLLNVFAPRNTVEFTRVLASDGILIVVIPNPSHLSDLRLRLKLLDIQENKDRVVIEQLSSNFELISAANLEYPILLDQETILRLVRMGPNYWHTSDSNWDAISEIGFIETKVSFKVLTFQHSRLSSTSQA